jgi:hypothetical protein
MTILWKSVISAQLSINSNVCVAMCISNGQRNYTILLTSLQRHVASCFSATLPGSIASCAALCWRWHAAPSALAGSMTLRKYCLCVQLLTIILWYKLSTNEKSMCIHDEVISYLTWLPVQWNSDTWNSMSFHDKYETNVFHMCLFWWLIWWW